MTHADDCVGEVAERAKIYIAVDLGGGAHTHKWSTTFAWLQIFFFFLVSKTYTSPGRSRRRIKRFKRRIHAFFGWWRAFTGLNDIANSLWVIILSTKMPRTLMLAVKLKIRIIIGQWGKIGAISGTVRNRVRYFNCLHFQPVAPTGGQNWSSVLIHGVTNKLPTGRHRGHEGSEFSFITAGWTFRPVKLVFAVWRYLATKMYRFRSLPWLGKDSKSSCKKSFKFET